MLNVQITGVVKDEPIVVKKYEDSTVYEFILDCKRDESITDSICVNYSISNKDIHKGDRLFIEGEMRTVNTSMNWRDEKTYLFAKKIVPANEDEFWVERTTASGEKFKANFNSIDCQTASLVTDVRTNSESSANMVVTTYRLNGKRDNFYCMLWGKLARIARAFAKGDELEIKGKLNGSAEYDSKGVIHTKTIIALYYVSRKG